MKIIAIGMNYPLHCKELHADEPLPQEPVIFMKPDSALLKDSKPFFIPDFCQQVDYETELVVRINRLGKNISERFAHRYYDAVTVGIDFTARDLQRKFRAEGKPWELCKGFDNSAAIGDWVPVEKFADIQHINFHLDIDGKTVQQGNTQDMLFKVDQIIAYVSQFCTLKIGDMLFTGTPVGVGPVQIDNHLEGYLENEKFLILRAMKIRVGFGFDVHRLIEGRELWLGGIKLEHELGLLGHSDADVLIHAICDALLGAANMRDIGYHFPDNAGEFKNIDSKILLAKTIDLIATKGYRVGNIDATVCAERPKLKAHIPEMQEVLAHVMNIEPEDVSIKATTTEKLGFTGREEGISAYATVLIERD